ncbi:hypothetical protein D3C71_2187090 [compost metagenome]
MRHFKTLLPVDGAHNQQVASPKNETGRQQRGNRVQVYERVPVQIAAEHGRDSTDQNGQ